MKRKLSMGKAADVYKAAETKAKSIGEQIKELKQLQENGSQSVEDLARKLEPLAQAMAILIEKAQASTETIERNNKKEHERLYRETESTIADWTEQAQILSETTEGMITAVQRSESAAKAMKKAGKGITIKVLAIAIVLGLLIGTATGAGSWHFLKTHYIKTKALEVWKNPKDAKIVIDGLLNQPI
ncbi:MAG: hypothetical protein GY710_02425 [Desulfobacteraceae bacterium]|nr:hypothetical protein [Desulfobacteraceae bacterium]